MPIGRDMGEWTMDADTPEHELRIFERAKASEVLTTSGEKVKLARWFGVWDRFQERLLPGWNCLLLVLMYAGLSKGWFAVSDEFKIFTMRAGAPRSSTSSSFRALASESRGVAGSSEVLNRLRANCMNTPHLVATILANTLSHRLMSGMSIFVSVVRAVHGHALVIATCPEKTAKFRTEIAQGAWRQELNDIVREAKDPAKLSTAMFLEPSGAREPQKWEVEEDATAARLIHKFIVHLLGSRVTHASGLSWSFPWKAAALLEENDGRLRVVLTEFEQWWEGLQALNEEASQSLEARRFLHDLVWPLWEWPTEIFLELRQCSFQRAAT